MRMAVATMPSGKANTLSPTTNANKSVWTYYTMSFVSYLTERSSAHPFHHTHNVFSILALERGYGR
jgi:hypothetical protein